MSRNLKTINEYRLVHKGSFFELEQKEIHFIVQFPALGDEVLANYEQKISSTFIFSKIADNVLMQKENIADIFRNPASGGNNCDNLQ